MNWAERFGVTGATDGNSIALDPTNGDIALAGYFSGSANLGGGLVTGGDAGGGGFLARFDSGGGYKWAHVFTSAAGVTPYGLAVDNVSNVLVGGTFDGPTDFGGGAVSPTGNQDIFLAKFASAGGFLWAKHFGVASKSCFFDAALFDPSGELYVVGETLDALNLGCGPLPPGGTVFTAKFDVAGSCLWSVAPTVTDSTVMKRAIALDPMGNVLVGSGFYGTINFGSGPLTVSGTGMDAYIAKYGPTGSLVWAKSFGTGGQAAQVTGVGTDASGDILVDGSFGGTLDFGCGALAAQPGGVNIFLAKLDPSGTCIWSKSFGDQDQQGGGPLAVDTFGGPVITGSFSGTVDFGGGTLVGAPVGMGAMYLAKFNSAGTYEWAYAGGPAASNAKNSGGLGIAVNAAAVVTVGQFQGGTLSLAGDVFTAVSQQDTYLASFAP